MSAFSTNELLPQDVANATQTALDRPIKGLCYKCSGDVIREAKEKVGLQIGRLSRELQAGANVIPMASIHSPSAWEYDVLGLVTAQTVTGTGIFSDVTSAFTDLFGTQSGTYNSKIKAGEDMCRSSLRLQTIGSGGNAIVAVDIDYSEVGGQRAMLMVCMTGTAIRINNVDQIAPNLGSEVAALEKLHRQLIGLQKAQRILAEAYSR